LQSLQLPINATQLYKQAKIMPYTILEKVYFGMADNFINRLNNPEIVQVIASDDCNKVMTIEYIIPNEAKQPLNLPIQIVDLVNLGICFDGILTLPQDYVCANDFHAKQAGYRYNAVTGESLVSDKKGEWQDGWYVFATNYFDNPFHIDFAEEALGFPVYYSQHGAVIWKPIKIADTLKCFERILKMLKNYSYDALLESSAPPLELDLSNEFWNDVSKEYRELDNSTKKISLE